MVQCAGFSLAGPNDGRMCMRTEIRWKAEQLSPPWEESLPGLKTRMG